MVETTKKIIDLESTEKFLTDSGITFKVRFAIN